MRRRLSFSLTLGRISEGSLCGVVFFTIGYFFSFPSSVGEAENLYFFLILLSLFLIFGLGRLFFLSLIEERLSTTPYPRRNPPPPLSLLESHMINNASPTTACSRALSISVLLSFLSFFLRANFSPPPRIGTRNKTLFRVTARFFPSQQPDSTSLPLLQIEASATRFFPPHDKHLSPSKARRGNRDVVFLSSDSSPSTSSRPGTQKFKGQVRASFKGSPATWFFLYPDVSPKMKTRAVPFPPPSAFLFPLCWKETIDTGQLVSIRPIEDSPFTVLPFPSLRLMDSLLNEKPTFSCHSNKGFYRAISC